MKALTIYQPYAEQIASGVKKIEYRSWPTSYRGRLAIHAGKKKCDGSDGLPLGAIVAVCELVDCVRKGFREYHWLLANVERLRNPICISGKQGLWDFGGKLK